MSIQSTPQDVYRAVVDYSRYDQWNPWLRVHVRESRQGKILLLTPHLGYVPLLFAFEDRQEGEAGILLRRQTGWTRFLFHAEREYMVYPKTDGGTIYATKFRLGGFLAPVMRVLFGRRVAQGIKAEGLALKKYCEARYPYPLAS